MEDTKAPLFGDPQTFPYVDESQKPEEAQVQSVCRQSQSCRRDYYATNDVIVARASKKTDINFAALQGSQKIGKYERIFVCLFVFPLFSLYSLLRFAVVTVINRCLFIKR